MRISDWSSDVCSSDLRLLEGKTVLVTGGSTGIGRAAAIGAAQHGATVAINYASSDDKAASCIAEIEALGQKGLAVKGDVPLPETRAAERRVGKEGASTGRTWVAPLP